MVERRPAPSSSKVDKAVVVTSACVPAFRVVEWGVEERRVEKRGGKSIREVHKEREEKRREEKRREASLPSHSLLSPALLLDASKRARAHPTLRSSLRPSARQQ